MDALSRIAQLGRNFPPWIAFRRSRYKRQFPQWSGSFLGVHESFSEAESHGPKDRPLGYDTHESAALYDDRLSRVYASDYPMLYWMRMLLSQDNQRIVDFGGHVGITYYAYERYLDYGQDLSWTIIDVPAVVARGQKLAQDRGRAHLKFTSEASAVGDHDLLIASGSLQYLESADVFETLGKVGKFPEHILLNRIPFHDRFTYVTLQNISSAYCPYRIFRKPDFLGSVEKLGYEIVDEWENLEHRCEHPFDPEYNVPSYRGFYLRRRAMH